MSHTAIKIGVIAVCTLILTSIVFVVMVAQIVSKERRLTEQVTLLATHQAQQETFFELKRIAFDSTGERQILQALHFARSSESVDFLNDIEALAPVLGISVETESLTEIATEAGDEWVEMSFAATGPLAGVEKFVALLENSPYALRTTSLKMEERSSRLWSLDITVQIKVLPHEA